jgi:hypothetical protein
MAEFSLRSRVTESPNLEAGLSLTFRVLREEAIE